MTLPNARKEARARNESHGKDGVFHANGRYKSRESEKGVKRCCCAHRRISMRVAIHARGIPEENMREWSSPTAIKIQAITESLYRTGFDRSPWQRATEKRGFCEKRR